MVIWSKSQIYILLSLSLSPVSSLSPRDFAQQPTFAHFRRRHGHHTWNRSPPWLPLEPWLNRRSFPTNTSLGGARIWPENHDFRRWFVRMPPELPAQISPPFLHQIDRVRHQEPDRILKGDLWGIEVARTICEWTFFPKSDFINVLMCLYINKFYKWVYIDFI